MKNKPGSAIIDSGTILEGDLRNCGTVEVRGEIKGSVIADRVIVQDGGRIFGTIVAKNAVVSGQVEGKLTVSELFTLLSSGRAKGDIRYGRLAVETGADLDASVKNIPPELAGDLQLAVRKGDTVKVTTTDLTAIDPDDDAKDLKFSISQPKNGFVALTTAPQTAVSNFSQSDLLGGKVVFKHNGDESDTASFDVIVTDAQGASSGAAKTVRVAVH